MIQDRFRSEQDRITQSAYPQRHIRVFAEPGYSRKIFSESSQASQNFASKRHIAADNMIDGNDFAGIGREIAFQFAERRQFTDPIYPLLLFSRNVVQSASADSSDFRRCIGCQ